MVLVKIISISDEVYEELSRMKNGKSFTELFKVLISASTSKGDPKNIITFLNSSKPISEEAANEIMDASFKGRKCAVTRKSALFE
jgi:predicted CopG family antitoxin